MLVSLVRYVRGYLKIRVNGQSAERFLNLCKNKKIDIWDLEIYEKSYLMSIKISGFRKLKPIARKTKSKITIEERIGLPFFFYEYRKRVVFLIGCISSILLMMSLTFFVWDIDCVGNQRITDEVILEFLETQKVFPGSLKKRIICEQLTKEIRKKFDDVIWVSCSMKGSKLTIHIKENVDVFSGNEVEEYACDLIAKKSGIITQIVTRNGIPKVEEGSEVKKGDILVSGSVEILNDAKEVTDTHFVHSDADILMKTIQEYNEMLSKKYRKKKYTKKTKIVPFLKIGRKLLVFDFSKNTYEFFDVFAQEKRLKIGDNINLPIIFGKKIIAEYEWEEKVYTDTEIETLLKEKFNLFCEKIKKKGIKIIENNLVITQTQNEGIAQANLILIEEDCFERKSIDF